MSDESDFEPYSPDEQRELDDWSAACARVIAFFETRGLEVGPFSDTPILVVDDMMAPHLIEIETGDYSILHPNFIDEFRCFLAEISTFAVTLQVCNEGPSRDDWPRMGLSFYQGKISDGLKRDYLPAPYNTYFYTNSRPDNRPDLPFV